jgi:hypothetical protein
MTCFKVVEVVAGAEVVPVVAVVAGQVAWAAPRLPVPAATVSVLAAGTGSNTPSGSPATRNSAPSAGPR